MIDKTNNFIKYLEEKEKIKNKNNKLTIILFLTGNTLFILSVILSKLPLTIKLLILGLISYFMAIQIKVD